MGELTVESLYEQVRALFPVQIGDEPTDPLPVTSGIRVLALRTPTLPPAAHTNVYLVGPQDGPVAVVDPGSPYADQQQILDAALAGVTVAMVVLTHHHGDHTGGARALAERWNVPIAAHPLTARRLASQMPVTRMIEDGEVVCGATAIFTPGHAEGHLCFEVADGDQRSIIAGDMVAGLGTILIDPSEGDMSLYLASLERLLARGSCMLLPAHGPPIMDGPGKLREYLAHRRMREQRVIAALAGASSSIPAGVHAQELVPTVYGDTPTALWPLAERSLLAHLRKLEREGLAVERGGQWSALRA